jgi:SAM-dependent methyltransferase
MMEAMNSGPTAQAGANAEIWERIYGRGHMLWYPYDIVVRIVHHLRNAGRLEGVILDHGCGSGNHLEFLVRLGLRAVGSDVSPSSLATVKSRFAGAKLPAPALHRIVPGAPLAGQLPPYDHLLAWGSIHYNRKPGFLRDLGELIARLPEGGSFVFAIPSLDDVAARESVREADGSRRIASDLSGQEGAIVSVPESREELLGWCRGIEVDECDRFGWTFRGRRSDYFFLYGRKARGA